MPAPDDLPVAASAYARIREAILNGEYIPGERLTSVRLADDLGVSRTPIRAALTRLKAEGLVEFTDGRAAWVPPLTVAAVEEAYEIAAALESLLVRKIALDIDAETLNALDAAVTSMEAAAADGDRASWVEGDERFHSLIRGLAGRELVSSMLERVDTVIDRVRFLSLNLRPEGAATSAAEHRAVIEALQAHDPQLAQRRHEAHLDRVRIDNVGFLRDTFIGGALPVSRPS